MLCTCIVYQEMYSICASDPLFSMIQSYFSQFGLIYESLNCFINCCCQLSPQQSVYRALYKVMQFLNNNSLAMVPFPCAHRPGCGYSSVYLPVVIEHEDTLHDGVTRYMCWECNWTTTHEDHLGKHIKCVHEIETNFNYVECGKHFTESFTWKGTSIVFIKSKSLSTDVCVSMLQASK